MLEIEYFVYVVWFRNDPDLLAPCYTILHMAADSELRSKFEFMLIVITTHVLHVLLRDVLTARLRFSRNYASNAKIDYYSDSKRLGYL